MNQDYYYQNDVTGGGYVCTHNPFELYQLKSGVNCLALCILTNSLPVIFRKSLDQANLLLFEDSLALATIILYKRVTWPRP